MKDESAVALGKKSAEKRFAGKTPEEISKIMSEVRKKGMSHNKTGTN